MANEWRGLWQAEADGERKLVRHLLVAMVAVEELEGA